MRPAIVGVEWTSSTVSAEYAPGSGDGQFQIVDTTLAIAQRLTHRFLAFGTGEVDLR